MSFYNAEIEARFRADAAEIISRFPEGHARSAMIPLLHLVQSVDGYVSTNGMDLIADILGCQRAEVSAVATFYTQFKRRPNGEYTVGVCTNAMCAVMGGSRIWETLERELGVGHEETTSDGKITLEQLECNAACDYAPVIMVNWEFFDNQTPDSALELVRALQAGQPVKPTRGPDVTPTFKEVSRILAGFPDVESAYQGVSAGEPSLQGLKVAAAHGFAAKSVQQAEADLAAQKAAEAAAAEKEGK